MATDEEFKKTFLAAQTPFERVKVCIAEKRYKIWTRRDKPNLCGNEFVDPILKLPPNYQCRTPARKSGGGGPRFVIEFEYSVTIMGATNEVYFKGYFTDDWTLKLEIQSLRKSEEI